MFCRVMFLRCSSLLMLPGTVLWNAGPACCAGAVSDQRVKFDATLSWESEAMLPSDVCLDTDLVQSCSHPLQTTETLCASAGEFVLGDQCFVLGDNVTNEPGGFVHTFSVVIPHVPVVMYSGKYSVASDLACASVLVVARWPSVACAYSRHSFAEWLFCRSLLPSCCQGTQVSGCPNLFVLKFNGEAFFFLNFIMEASFFYSVCVPLDGVLAVLRGCPNKKSSGYGLLSIQSEVKKSFPQCLARFGILEESRAAAAWNGQGAVSVAFHYMMFMAVNCWLFQCAAALDFFFMHLVSCSAAAAIMFAFAMLIVHALVDLCRVQVMIEPFVMMGSVLNSKVVLGITTLSQPRHDALRVECSPTRKAMPGVAAAASAAAIQVSFESVPGMPETEHRGSLSDGEKMEFQILVKGLNGRHIALPVVASMTVLELAALVHCRSLVPVEAFYLVKEGKRMGDHNMLVQEGVLPGDTVHMCGRLRAGAQPTFPSHMDWFCVACNKGGCWASRPRCFRCGLSRAEGEQVMHNIGNGRGMRNGSVQPAPRHVPPRETQFPGRSGAGPFVSSCPTWRPPKSQKQKRNVPSSAPQPDVLSILRELGCSSDLLMQVQSKLGGASSPEVPAPGIKAKKLADAQAALGRAKTHQLVLREQHDAMAVKLSKAKLALDENQERIQKLTAEVQLAHAELTPPRSEDGASCNAGDAVELDGAEVSDASFESEGHDDSDIFPEDYKDSASVPLKKRKMIAKPKPKPDKPVVIVTAAQARDFFLGLPEEERLRFIGECSSAGASSASMELSPTPCG